MTDTIYTNGQADTAVEPVDALVGSPHHRLDGVTEVTALRNTARALATQIESMEHDWKLLNDHLNTYADENNMCSDYEGYLENWNRGFRLMKLEGRVSDYSVKVKVKLEYYVSINVSAKNADDADDQVSEMQSEDIVRAISDRAYYDDVEWEVTDVESA